MKKGLVLIIALIILSQCLTGCGNNLPSVTINPSMFESLINIDIGSGYKYTGFDIESTDGGKDLILHFVEDEE